MGAKEKIVNTPEGLKEGIFLKVKGIGNKGCGSDDPAETEV